MSLIKDVLSSGLGTLPEVLDLTRCYFTTVHAEYVAPSHLSFLNKTSNIHKRLFTKIQADPVFLFFFLILRPK